MLLCTFYFKCCYIEIILQPYAVVDFVLTFNRWEVYSFKQVEFIRKRVQKIAKVEDIGNLFNSWKEAVTPALVASATDDVSNQNC